MMLPTKWLDYKTAKKEKKEKRKKTGVELGGWTSIKFVAELVLGSNPKVPKVF
jgi:hypothetical protein